MCKKNSVYIYIYICVCVCVCMYMCMDIYIHKCVYVYMYMCTHTNFTMSKLVLINHVIICVKQNNNSIGDRRSCVIFICPCKLLNYLISYIYLISIVHCFLSGHYSLTARSYLASYKLNQRGNRHCCLSKCPQFLSII